MVENIEELGAELGGEAFLEFRLLEDGNIPVLEPQVAEAVTPRIADGSQRGRNEDRLAVRAYVTANTIESVHCAGSSCGAQARCGRGNPDDAAAC